MAPKSSKKLRTKRKQTAPVAHMFQIQLTDPNLDAKQIERLASSLRATATKELLKMDFRIEELTPVFRRKTDPASNCGGACSACSSS